MGFFTSLRRLWTVIRSDEPSTAAWRLDDTRERIHSGLQEMDAEARLADAAQPEENIGYSLGTPLGLIRVGEGAIRWINVRRSAPLGLARRHGSSYDIELGVPDRSLGPRSPKVHIKSVKVKRLPLLSHVEDVRWKGKDFGLRIIDRLNSDDSLKALMWNTDLEMRSFPDKRCWLLSMWQISRIAPSRSYGSGIRP